MPIIICLTLPNSAVGNGDTRQVRKGGAVGGLDEVGSVIIDLIREGRRLLTNIYQVTKKHPAMHLLKTTFYEYPSQDAWQYMIQLDMPYFQLIIVA